jgi:hypothetical protein
MIQMRCVILLMSFGAPAWSALYKIPGTSSSVNITNPSTDPSLQFTPDVINRMLATLATFPPSMRNLVQNIQANPGQPNNTDTDRKNTIIFSFSSAQQIPLVTQFLDLGVGLLTYYNMSASDQKAYNALPKPSGSSPNVAVDFAFDVNAWYQHSYANIFDPAIVKDLSALGSYLFTALKFADPATSTIRTYEVQCITLNILPLCTTVPKFSDDKLAWDVTGVSFGGYKFLLNQNYQLIGAQQGTSTALMLGAPVAAVPPSLVVAFTPPSNTVQVTANRMIEIAEPIAQNYQFSPVEIKQIQALLSHLPADQFSALRVIQAEPLTVAPTNQNLSSGEFCSYSSAVQITCYLNTNTIRQDNPLDMNAQLMQALGSELYLHGLTDNARQEWSSLWSWDLSGGAQNGFVTYYQQWASGSAEALSQDIGAAINGTSLPLQIALFVSSYFLDSTSNTVQFGSIDQNGLFSSRQLALSWTDGSTLRFANYVFQIQQDPNSGQYQITSIQQDGQDSPNDISGSPVVIPNAFTEYLSRLAIDVSTPVENFPNHQSKIPHP